MSNINVVRADFDRLKAILNELREAWSGEPESRWASGFPYAYW